ncbi:MAG: LptA/OstA family protein [Pseudomonadota bacterium]
MKLFTKILLIGVIVLTSSYSLTQEDIIIDAEQTMVWDRDNQQFIARGNAQATRGETIVRADEIIAYYQDGQAQEITSITAEHGVVITNGDQTYTGAFARYDLDAEELEIIGSPARVRTPDGTISAHERLVISDNRVDAYVDAKVDYQGSTLHAEHITMILDQNGDLKTMQAKRNVHIENKSNKVTGEHATFDSANQIVEVSGDAVFYQDGAEVFGSKIIFDLEKGIGTVMPGDDGRVRGIIIDQ